MRIISLHDGHNATACYLENGEVRALVSEERFVNRKNQGGFPAHALAWILGEHALRKEEIDAVVFPSIIYTHDYTRGYGQSLRHRFIYALSRLIPRAIVTSQGIVKPYVGFFRIFRRRMLAGYARQQGLDIRKIHQAEHHQAHAYAALYASDLLPQGEPVLVFTLDDSGDGISSRVSLRDRSAGYRTLQESSSFNSLGNLYSTVTRYLGMRAGEHEYKLMGMAPYVPDDKSERSFRLFLGYVGVDGAGRIRNRVSYGPLLLDRVRKDFQQERFDNVASGIQRAFEHVVLAWVRFWAARTGIRSAVFGGGGFMNVKANMRIAEQDCFDRVFFCPSCGDESLALGGAYLQAEKMGEPAIAPLETLYKGPSFSDAAVERAIASYGDRVTCERSDRIEALVARLLMEGQIVARFKGAAEWGARALGNRSILCRADDPRIIHRLNKSIKNRDFWMPFAASMLASEADRYLVNPRGIRSPFMMLAFQTTPVARREILAALHPYDHTCRPQMVTAEANPDYHRLLVHFKEMTGLSGLLNTSFNLHGYPIAGTPERAIETLLGSQLDGLAMGSFLVRRKP